MNEHKNSPFDKLRTKAIQLLRWSEKYTGTDMVYLTGNGFWLLSAQGVASLSAFAVTVLLTNLLPKETFGQYRFILSIIPILAIFTLPGIGTALTRSVARGALVNLRGIAKTKIKWGLLSSLTSLLGALYYFYKGNELLAYAFALSAIFLPFFETFFIYTSYYKGLQNFKTPAIYEGISRILQALLMVATVLLTKSVLALIAAFFVGQIITRLFFYLRTLKFQTSKQGFAVDDTIAYGKHLSAIGALGIVADNMDKLLVWHFLGAKALAIYAVAFAIPSQLVGIFGHMSALAEVKFASRNWNAEETKILIKKLARAMLIMTTPVALYILLAPKIFQLIFPTYLDSVRLTQVLALLILIMPINSIIIANLQAQKRTLYIFVITILNISMFTLVFLYTHGALGLMSIAVAYLVTEVSIIAVWLLSDGAVQKSE